LLKIKNKINMSPKSLPTGSTEETGPEFEVDGVDEELF